jgi:hypothetical protein
MVGVAATAERVINNYLTVCQHCKFAIMSQLAIECF